jgi:hypothetical protein
MPRRKPGEPIKKFERQIESRVLRSTYQFWISELGDLEGLEKG